MAAWVCLLVDPRGEIPRPAGNAVGVPTPHDFASLVDRLPGRLQGQLVGLGLTAPSAIAAIGAGVHEELVFRLALIAGLVAVMRPLGHRIAVLFAIAGSSVLFAAAHHVGAQGEAWT